ncbi:MAG: hypothetical protein KJ621_06625 [Proteobacteria bacterium]|nr:hypothetical protein [Pseudomonadota bacterium]
MRRLLVLVLALSVLAAGCGALFAPVPPAGQPASPAMKGTGYLPRPTPNFFQDRDPTSFPYGYMGGP